MLLGCCKWKFLVSYECSNPTSNKVIGFVLYMRSGAAFSGPSSWMHRFSSPYQQKAQHFMSIRQDQYHKGPVLVVAILMCLCMWLWMRHIWLGFTQFLLWTVLALNLTNLLSKPSYEDFIDFSVSFESKKNKKETLDDKLCTKLLQVHFLIKMYL